MIVAAFGGYDQVMDAYHVALKEGYRFGTYGGCNVDSGQIMAKVYLGLGTNLGDKEQNLRDAVQKIEEQVGNVVPCLLFMLLPPGALLLKTVS